MKWAISGLTTRPFLLDTMPVKLGKLIVDTCGFLIVFWPSDARRDIYRFARSMEA